jgi:hypothetical protein
VAEFKINVSPAVARVFRQRRVFCFHEQNEQNCFYFQKLIILKTVAIIVSKNVNAIKTNRGYRCNEKVVEFADYGNHSVGAGSLWKQCDNETI